MGTIDMMRWILVGSTIVYVIPIISYIILFKKPNILWEIILGSFSFVFYGPTYLNILNIYSLCRIDDISWGTKGLDSGGSNSNSKLKDTWKLIKFVHVSKYVFWNIVASVVLLSLGASYTPKFFITIIVVVVMAASLGIKIFIALVYMLRYKLSSCSVCAREEEPCLTDSSVIQDRIKSFEGDIRS